MSKPSTVAVFALFFLSVTVMEHIIPITYMNISSLTRASVVGASVVGDRASVMRLDGDIGFLGPGVSPHDDWSVGWRRTQLCIGRPSHSLWGEWHM